MPDAVRKPLGVILIILAIAAYAALVALASGWISGLPIWAQSVIYLIAGLAWVPALMPLTRWTETGRFTRPRALATRGPEETNT